MKKKIIVAIDGYSSCGKSTLAKQLAKHLSYTYIDSGAMYRAFALYCVKNNLDPIDNKHEIIALTKTDKVNIYFKLNTKTNKNITYLNNNNVEDEIRKIKIANKVSKVAQILEVREKMIYLQRQLGEKKEIVMDGRDIGSKVFPEAEVKLFLTCDQKIRIKRRYDELKTKDKNISIDEVRKNILLRDFEDEKRTFNPLMKTKDAHVINNSIINQEEQFQIALKIIESHLN